MRKFNVDHETQSINKAFKYSKAKYTRNKSRKVYPNDYFFRNIFMYMFSTLFFAYDKIVGFYRYENQYSIKQVLLNKRQWLR